MIDTKSFSDQEIDILLDALDIYEKTKSPDDLEYVRMREVADVLEGQLKRQVDIESEEISHEAISFVNALSSFKKEMILKEKEAISAKKLMREKITLLKAKLILLLQDRAVDSLFEDNRNGDKNEK